MKTVEVFTGNRAEYGLLSSVVGALGHSCSVRLVVSGAHLFKRWGTFDEIRKIESERSHVEVVPLEIDEQPDSVHGFARYLPLISSAVLNMRTAGPAPDGVVVLGDRIETFAYASAAFYLGDILFHLCGGDVADVLITDTSVRHAITKLSHIHLVTNEQSRLVLGRMGEEPWRIHKIGLPSLDVAGSLRREEYDRLLAELEIMDEPIILATLHPEPAAGRELNEDYMVRLVQALSQSGRQALITYPNNDPHRDAILDVLNSVTRESSPNLRIVPHLGNRRYMTLLKYARCIMMGNSSGIVTESSFFLRPGLLLGNRQVRRYRGCNISEYQSFDAGQIVRYIDDTFSRYDELQDTYRRDQGIYGMGDAGPKAAGVIEQMLGMDKDKVLMKQNVIADQL